MGAVRSRSRWAAWLGGALALAAPAVCHAQDTDRLDCDFVLKAIGVIPVDVLVDAIESDRPIAPDLLGCAEKAEAPAAVVDAIRRRLAIAADQTDTPWIVVDTADERWPEALGRRLAPAIQVLQPGNVPMVVMFVREEDRALPPWWYLEFQDRVAGRLLERLPPDSAAAESPEVLDAEAWSLLDPTLAPDLHDRLRRMGYRRVLLIQESPVVGSDATDLAIEIRNLDDASSRSSIVRVLPQDATSPDPGAVRVKVTARPSPAPPGGTVELAVDPIGGALQPGEVSVWHGGVRLAVLEPIDISWLGTVAIPEEARGSWDLHVVHPTDAGGLGWLKVSVPIKAGADPDGKARRLDAEYDLATTSASRKKSKVVKRVGVLIGAGLGGGADLFDGNNYLKAPLRAQGPWTLDGITYTPVVDPNDAFGLTGYVHIPIEAAVQIPGLRIAGRLDLRPAVQGADPHSTPTAAGGEVTYRRQMSVDPGGSLLLGARNPRTGGWFGVFAAWQARKVIGSYDGQRTVLPANRGVIGAQLTVDHDLRKAINLGFDVRSTIARFGGSGLPANAAAVAVQVDAALRVAWRAR